VFSDFEISRFPIVWKMFVETKTGFEIPKNNHTSVLGRPWTKQMVLIDFSGTLKFQFTENNENQRFVYSVRQKIEDLGPKKGTVRCHMRI
jgi:hypothetical protein